MAVPKHRTSKARTRRKRSINAKLEVVGLVTCSNCGTSKLPHRICPKCGFYKGAQVIRPEDLA